MAESFLSICPHCEAKLKLKNPELVGRKAKCPKCAEPFIVKRAKRKATPQPATVAASAPAAKPTPKPPPAPAASENDWLNEDLGSFNTDDDWPPASPAAGPAPPLVTGPKKKRKVSSSGLTRKKRRRSSPGDGSLLVSCCLAALAGCVAAAIGTGIWLVILIVTEYEIGLVAWAIGALVGLGTRLGSRDDIIGDVSGYIAAVTALLAVTVPKLILVFVLNLAGAGLALGDVFSPFDALWIFLAVGSAYRVGSGQAGEE